MNQPATIAILGGGYAGLFAAHRAARAAAKTHRSPVRVVLVDAEDSWEERARWHQLATGQKIGAWRRGRIFTGTGVVLVCGTVTGIDLDNRTLTFAGDQPALPFDRLVYTPGSRSNARSVPGVLENGHTLDSAETSRQLAQALARQPAGRMLIIGGGLTGIQTAAATAQRYPKATVTLLSSAPIGPELPEKARAYVHAALTRLGVDIIPDHHRVETVEPVRACWNGGQLEADLIAWTAGFTASGLGEQAGLKVAASGQVAVDADLRSLSHPFVFAAGDGAAVPRASSPYGAYAATATGATAGTNAACDLSGQTVTPLDMGYSLIAASLGRHDAVAQLLQPDGTPRRQMLTGRPANTLKEAIEHYVALAVRAERRIPGLYHWRPAPRQ
jgi:NADH:ubiquinone reductase (H+-translocating)